MNLCDVRKGSDEAHHTHANDNEVRHQTAFLVAKLLEETVQRQLDHFHCGELISQISNEKAQITLFIHLTELPGYPDQ
jgi:hypothetical protein